MCEHIVWLFLREAEFARYGVVKGAIQPAVGVGGGDDEVEFRPLGDGVEGFIEDCYLDWGRGCCS